MRRAPTVANVLDRLGPTLRLEPVYLQRESCAPLPAEPPAGGFPTLVGHLNVVQPNRLQVFGPTELGWWNSRGQDERDDLLDELFRDDLYGLIVTDNQDMPTGIVERARLADVPVLRSPDGCERVISTLRHVLGQELAARVVLHGVFIDVLGLGVLLTGGPAVGKSELALELVSRGHSLVADDSPEFSRPAPDAIEGEADDLIRDFLEVRGLGVLNIRLMYGDSAIRHHKRLQLIIHLEPLTDDSADQFDRLDGRPGHSEVLGVTIPTITLPVAPGRNLAVMVEAAVRSFLLARRGYSAANEFIGRQEKVIRRNEGSESEG